MSKHTFIYTLWEETGLMGWTDRKKLHFDPIRGIGVPHDIAEHFKDGDGGIEDELQALGAMWLLRGETGLFRSGLGHYSFTNRYEVMGDGFLDLWDHLPELGLKHCPFDPDQLLSRNPAIREGHHYKLDTWNEIRPHAFRGIKANEDEEVVERRIEEFLDLCKSWFIHGMYRCERRYRGLDMDYLGNSINRAADEVTALTKELCDDDSNAGRKLFVQFTPTEYRWEVRLEDEERFFRRMSKIN